MTTPNVPVDGAKRDQDQAVTAKAEAPKADVKPTTQVSESAKNESKIISSPDAAKALSSTTPAKDSMKEAGDPKVLEDAKKKLASDEEKAEDETKRLKSEREAEQSDIEMLEQAHVEANANNNLFHKIAEENKVFADQSRDEHREMRLREDAEKRGDPTRDPAAKQAAMDMNTPQEGALEDAANMSQGKSGK